MTVSAAPTAPRRVLATRNTKWARTLAWRLREYGVRPSAVSMASIGFALASATAFILSGEFTDFGRAALLIGAAACVQLRLLCNLLDGMLAVEGGLKSATGDIYNDLPDRFADVVILVGAGYSVRGLAFVPILGWAAAVAAVFTAYVRVLGGSLGLTQRFDGPMAKQHRMFALTVAALLAAGESFTGTSTRAIPVGLAVIVVGSLATAVRRTRRILAEASAR